MNWTWMAGLVFLLGLPLQVKQPNACEHAAPPQGMRWVCAAENPCDCHLVSMMAEDQAEGGSTKSLTAPAQNLASRITFFAIPAYPEAPRRAGKQGAVSASLILNAGGAVQEVRIQSGDPQLTDAVRATLQQWRFTPGHRVETIPVSVKFVLSENATGSVTGTSLLNTVVTAQPVH